MSLQMNATSMPFEVAHARDAVWTAGLRGFFEYRDLGIAKATGGRIGAHVIRSRELLEKHGERHHHELEFQMIYILRGSITFEYEGQGTVVLEEGACVLQPPGIRHTELGHSPDVEILEITLPAEFGTKEDRG